MGKTTYGLLAGLAAISVVNLAPPDAHADAAGAGCQTVLWGFLGSERRTLCDGPIRPDGSWTRERAVWTPAHYVPVTCSGYYYISCSGGYAVSQSIDSDETYPVTPDTVLPDEPGHLICRVLSRGRRTFRKRPVRSP
jgi:hypothetical protein